MRSAMSRVPLLPHGGEVDRIPEVAAPPGLLAGADERKATLLGEGGQRSTEGGCALGVGCRPVAFDHRQTSPHFPQTGRLSTWLYSSEDLIGDTEDLSDRDRTRETSEDDSVGVHEHREGDAGHTECVCHGSSLIVDDHRDHPVVLSQPG